MYSIDLERPPYGSGKVEVEYCGNHDEALDRMRAIARDGARIGAERYRQAVYTLFTDDFIEGRKLLDPDGRELGRVTVRVRN